MKENRFFVALFLLSIFLAGCSKNLQLQQYMPKSVSSANTIPDSLHVRMDFRITKNRLKENITVHAFLVPRKRYRLEFTGPLGIHLGSLLWKPNGWLLTLTRENTVFRGQGNRIPATLLGMKQLPEIHDLLAPFWGEILPANWREARRNASGKNDLFEGLDQHTPPRRWTAVMDRSSGQIQRLSYPDQKNHPLIFFADWKSTPLGVLPGRTTFSFPTTEKLEVFLDAAEMKPWSQKIWRLELPTNVKILDFSGEKS